MILHGPPGVGKTTIARIVAEASAAEFEELSAVSARVDDVRAVLARARDRLGGQRPPDAPLHRRDPPLRQAAAGLRPARGRGRPRDADRRDDREPVLRGQPGAPLALHGDRARAADPRGARPGARARRGRARRRRARRGRRRDRAARRRGRPHRAPDARARLGDRDGGRRGASRVEHVEDVARKRPLRYDRAGDRHYDLASAFIKSMRGSDPGRRRLLPRGDARGRRGPTLPRAPHRDRGERGRRQRRPARAPRRGRGSAGGRARRAPRGAAQPRAGGDLHRAGAEVERVGPGDLAARGRTSGARASPPRPRCCATRTTAAQPRAGTARATSPRTTTRARRDVDHLPEGLRGRAYYVPSANGEEAEETGMAIGTGDKAPEFDLEEAAGQPRVRLSNYLGRSNVLLVFHPFAFTRRLHGGGAGPPGEPGVVPQRQHGDRVRLV